MGPNKTQDSAPPAERALAFISKSLEDVQRNAKTDFQLMSARAESFRHLTSKIDEWENIKFPLGSGKEVSAAKLFRKLQDSSKAFTRPITLEELEVFKKFKHHMSINSPNLQRSISEPNFFKNDWSKSFAPPRVNTARGIINLEGWNSGKGATKWRIGAEDWEPFKRVKESLKELEVTAANSNSPSEFFDNVKKNWKLNLPPSATKQQPNKDVYPLDMTELAEMFIRESEAILDQFGIKTDVPLKVVKNLQKVSKINSNPIHPSRSVSSQESDQLSERITRVIQSTGYRHVNEIQLLSNKQKEASDKRRSIAIFTTASLPWMTGTAVNPLLRAAYLAKEGNQMVTLLVPWLTKSDQKLVYPNQMVFDSPSEQEQYVRDWLHERVGFCSDFKIAFYPGKFSLEKRSILAVGDISSYVSDGDADVAVLEEPEHLTWYYHGRRWTDKFKKVIGIVHTNYLEYVRREKNGAMQAFLLEHVNNWMVRCYCHKVVRLSAATQNLPRSIVCNVHGVGVKFLEVGKKMVANQEECGKEAFSKGAYYLGKMVWSKGYRELLDLLSENKERLKDVELDVFGSGEDSDAVRLEAKKHDLPISFFKGRDHGDPSLHHYKVFINPSMSDVVCTTTAEALAMGKIVVCADHPSNEFFKKFPNCYMYKSNEEFVQKVKEAMDSEPIPLSEDQRHSLSWESATDRFLDCAELKPNAISTSSSSSSLPLDSPAPSSPPPCPNLNPFDKANDFEFGSLCNHDLFSLPLTLPNMEEAIDRGLAFTHFMASGIEAARHVLGALPDTMHCGKELSEDLGLPPPSVQRPVYGW